MINILYFINNPDKAESIRKLSKDLGLLSSEIKRADFNKKLIEILANDSKKAVPPVVSLYSQPDIIIFNGLKDSQLDEFLSHYKERGIEATPLKAIVTPFNMMWTIADITDELRKENAQLR